METTPRGAFTYTLPAFESHQLSVAVLRQVTTKEVEAVLSGSSFTRYQIKAIQMHMRLEKIGGKKILVSGNVAGNGLHLTPLAQYKNCSRSAFKLLSDAPQTEKVWPASRELEFCKLINNLCSRSFFLASAESAFPFAWGRHIVV